MNSFHLRGDWSWCNLGEEAACPAETATALMLCSCSFSQQ